MELKRNKKSNIYIYRSNTTVRKEISQILRIYDIHYTLYKLQTQKKINLRSRVGLKNQAWGLR